MMASRLQVEVVSPSKKASLSSNTFHKGDTSDSATPETGDDGEEHASGDGGVVGDGDSTPEASAAASPQIALETRTSGDVVIDHEAGHEVHLQQVRQQGDEASDGSPSRLRSQSQAPQDQEKDWNDHDGSIESDDDDESDVSDDDSDDNLVWKVRLTCGKIVNNEYVQVTIIMLIIINAFMMGVATFDFVTEHSRVLKVFEWIDKGFLVIFTVEVAMQLVYLGIALFGDGWLVFDFLIVVFSWSFEQLQVVRAFRIFRAFRLITRVKPLRDLVLAIGAVLPRMYAIGALLMLVFYIYSVLFTELFKELELSDNYFKTLDASLFTCMEMMTLEWGQISREVMEVYSWAWAPFLTFIAMTGFIVFNLIVAVVCDAVAVTEKTVRQLEGIESDNPLDKLEQAQERIDLLQCHINDMLRTQQAVQDMIEVMAGEMLHLDSELRRSEQREADLRIQVDRRLDYQKSMESTRQIHVFERNTGVDRDRKEPLRHRRRDSGGSKGAQRRHAHDDASRTSSRSGSRSNVYADDGSQGRRRSGSRRQMYRQTSRSSRGSSKSVLSDL